MGATDFRITQTKPSDIREIQELLVRDANLVLMPWENEALLSRALELCPTGNLVVRDAHGMLVGACLAGHFAGRGTIPHVMIAEGYQHHGLGTELVRRSCEALKSLGIEICHVLVTRENITGRRFWQQKMKFAAPGLIALEVDLDPPEFLDPDPELVESESFDEVSELVKNYQPGLMKYLRSYGVHPSGDVVIHRRDGRIVGVAVVGSYGVRGFLHSVIGPELTVDERTALVRSALGLIASWGIYRVHCFLSAEDSLVPFLQERGFQDITAELVETAI